MAKSLITDVDLALLYIEGTPPEYFDEFRRLAAEDRLVIVEESRENTPYATIEWMAPTAIAIYISCRFIDAFVKRAADDCAAATYPKLKSIVKSLVNKALSRDRNKYHVVASSENKVTSPGAMIFSVYSETKAKRRAKFIFHEAMTEVEYEESVEKIFTTLAEHHATEGTEDRVSREMEAVTTSYSREAYLIYNRKTAQWEVVDPVKEAMNRRSSAGDDPK